MTVATLRRQIEAVAQPTPPIAKVLDAEQALLGMALCDATRYLPELDAEHFSEGLHQRIWSEIGALLSGEFEPAVAGETIPTLLLTRFLTDPALKAFGGARYIGDLIDHARPGDPRPYAREVHFASVQRRSASLRDSDGVVTAAGMAWMLEQADLIEALWAPQSTTLQLLDPAAWDGQRAPARQWTWRDQLPARQATYLTGAGSAGKSLLAQQLATHVALGRDFLGVETRQEVALYLTCEDDAEELHRRQQAICEELGVSMVELSGRLHLVSLVGLIGNELCTFDNQGRMATMAAWERLRSTVLQIGAGFIALDNTAHLFAGNENDRHQVAVFCGLMNKLAADSDAAVLFIGHPNKAGDSFSGSTAWENQVRSRLFLSRVAEEDGSELDPDARVLTREKSNYARKGGAITFRWFGGAFVREEDLPGGMGTTIALHALERSQDERFLTCLAKATEEGRATSASRNAANYAPKLFATMPSGKGIGQRGFEAALQRLLDGGEILDRQPLFKNARRQPVLGLAPAHRSAQRSAQGLAQGCSSVGETDQ